MKALLCQPIEEGATVVAPGELHVVVVVKSRGETVVVVVVKGENK